jgi:hypothetical protein
VVIDHIFLNQVLPLALSQAGKLVFHGCAIEIDGQAHAFLGRSGSGKSTLAASFASHGFRFLTDDGLLLEQTSSGLFAVPSHPSIRLWEDSQSALDLEGAAIAPSLGSSSKSRLLAGGRLAYCDVDLPLKRIYFLGDGSSANVVFRSVDAKQALLRHFNGLSSLASLPIFCEFDYPRKYELLPDVVQSVIVHSRSERGAFTERLDGLGNNLHAI